MVETTVDNCSTFPFYFSNPQPQHIPWFPRPSMVPQYGPHPGVFRSRAPQKRIVMRFGRPLAALMPPSPHRVVRSWVHWYTLQDGVPQILFS